MCIRPPRSSGFGFAVENLTAQLLPGLVGIVAANVTDRERLEAPLEDQRVILGQGSLASVAVLQESACARSRQGERLNQGEPTARRADRASD
jgi:hypothetical protein